MAPMHWGIQDIHSPLDDFGDMSVCKQIMTVEQDQAFALQRYKTAREATAFIGLLMSEFGFLPSSVGESETLVIGDTEEKVPWPLLSQAKA